MMKRETVIVVMGVSGCGKSTVGRLLAEQMGFQFLDADDYHPSANVAKMRSGQPLTDDDREPWLMHLVALLEERAMESRGVVLACSALKASYRRTLSSGAVIPRFVLLDGSKDLIAGRMAARPDHFMPVGLLESQFETFEVPSAAICINIDKPVDAIVAEIEESLMLPSYKY